MVLPIVALSVREKMQVLLPGRSSPARRCPVGCMPSRKYCLTTAAAPAAMGHAMLVPDMAVTPHWSSGVVPVPEPLRAEYRNEPGANTSYKGVKEEEEEEEEEVKDIWPESSHCMHWSQ